jgi:hypothetical protein
MSGSGGGSLEAEGVEALAYMEKALELLDTFDLDVEVGAHLDLAICRLRDAIQSRATTKPKEP